MKYIIRSGKVKGEGRYLPLNRGSRPFYTEWPITRTGAWRERVAQFDTPEEAREAYPERSDLPTRIVRLLSHDEAKAKAVRVVRGAPHVVCPHCGWRQNEDHEWCLAADEDRDASGLSEEIHESCEECDETYVVTSCLSFIVRKP